MTTPGLGPVVAPSFDDAVWSEEVGRLTLRSASRHAAERARREIEAVGLDRKELFRCEAEGTDGTDLRGCLKTYVPLGDGPASEKPLGFVFELRRAGDGTVSLRFLAFGERHPAAPARSVYERAHKRRHGRYPNP